MKALLTLGMVVEVGDFEHMEELRRSCEEQGWTQMVRAAQSVAEEHGREFKQEDLDEAVLYLGVQTWPLPERSLADE